MKKTATMTVVITINIILLFAVGLFLGKLTSSNAVVNAEPPAPTGPPVPPVHDLPPVHHAESIAQAAGEAQAPNTNPLPPSTEQLQQDLISIGWNFVPADATSATQSQITQATAQDIVNKAYPQSQQAKLITSFLGLLENVTATEATKRGQQADQTFASARLVWIVTLSGAMTQSSGPPQVARKTSNELNIIVDARSGEILMDFVWTR